MVTNQDIERTFYKANIELNQKINSALYDFHKPDIELTQTLQEKIMQKSAARNTNNPLEVSHGK